MKLVPVKDVQQASAVLFRLLQERPQRAYISHERMPTWDEHEDFVDSAPFRYWYLLRIIDIDGPLYVGALECTDLNEIGIAVLERYRGKGYGRAALKLFLATHKPLPAVPAKRNGRWLANIAPENEAGRRFFERNGFRLLQQTWVLI